MVSFYLYVESKKQMSKQRNSHRYIEQTGGCQRGGGLGIRKREEIQRSNRKATVYYLTYYISIINNWLLLTSHNSLDVQGRGIINYSSENNYLPCILFSRSQQFLPLNHLYIIFFLTFFFTWLLVLLTIKNKVVILSCPLTRHTVLL